jgi:hypothetical protein
MKPHIKNMAVITVRATRGLACLELMVVGLVSRGMEAKVQQKS